jgi:hypothetical protein
MYLFLLNYKMTLKVAYHVQFIHKIKFLCAISIHTNIKEPNRLKILIQYTSVQACYSCVKVYGISALSGSFFYQYGSRKEI